MFHRAINPFAQSLYYEIRLSKRRTNAENNVGRDGTGIWLFHKVYFPVSKTER